MKKFGCLSINSLFERIIQLGNLPDTDSASISSHLVSIIKYLHKNGIVIRNLIPEIIFFEEKDGLEMQRPKKPKERGKWR